MKGNIILYEVSLSRGLFNFENYYLYVNFGTLEKTAAELVSFIRKQNKKVPLEYYWLKYYLINLFLNLNLSFFTSEKLGNNFAPIRFNNLSKNNKFKTFFEGIILLI